MFAFLVETNVSKNSERSLRHLPKKLSAYVGESSADRCKSSDLGTRVDQRCCAKIMKAFNKAAMIDRLHEGADIFEYEGGLREDRRYRFRP